MKHQPEFEPSVPNGIAPRRVRVEVSVPEDVTQELPELDQYALATVGENGSYAPTYRTGVGHIIIQGPRVAYMRDKQPLRLLYVLGGP